MPERNAAARGVTRRTGRVLGSGARARFVCCSLEEGAEVAAVVGAVVPLLVAAETRGFTNHASAAGRAVAISQSEVHAPQFSGSSS